MLNLNERNASVNISEVLGIKSVLLERLGEMNKPLLWLTFPDEYSVAIDGVTDVVTAISMVKFYETHKERLPLFELKGIERKSFDWFSEAGEKKGTVFISESFFDSVLEEKIYFAKEKYLLEIFYLPVQKKLITKYGNEKFLIEQSHIGKIEMEKYNLSVNLGSIEVSLEEMKQLRSGGKIKLDPEMLHEIEIKLGNMTIATGKTPSVKEIEVSEIKSSFIKQLS